MSLSEKVKRALTSALNPERIILNADGDVGGYVVSKRFRGMESFDRQMMVDKILRAPASGLTPAEFGRVVLLVALTPKEYQLSDVREWVEGESRKDVIAEQTLTAVFPDGQVSHAYLSIGRPTRHPKGDWVCPAEAQGLRLWEGRSEIFGVDSWHALMLGIRFLRSMLSAEVERGAVFHSEDGRQAVTIEEVFVLHEIT